VGTGQGVAEQSELAAQLVPAGGQRADVGLRLAGHPVERGTEPADLVTRAHRYPGRQVARGHLIGRAGELGQWAGGAQRQPAGHRDRRKRRQCDDAEQAGQQSRLGRAGHRHRQRQRPTYPPAVPAGAARGGHRGSARGVAEPAEQRGVDRAHRVGVPDQGTGTVVQLDPGGQAGVPPGSGGLAAQRPWRRGRAVAGTTRVVRGIAQLDRYVLGGRAAGQDGGGHRAGPQVAAQRVDRGAHRAGRVVQPLGGARPVDGGHRRADEDRAEQHRAEDDHQERRGQAGTERHAYPLGTRCCHTGRLLGF
jgi:hypothetical protein